jgi:phosphoglycolate phosphatase
VIRAVVFDFDGTLTELTLDFGLMKSELDKLILTFVPPGTLEVCKGSFMLETIRSIEEALGPRGAAFKKQSFALLRDMEIAAAMGKEVFPYTRDVLKALKDMHIKVGIMTRNCTDAVKSIFPDLDDFIDALVTRDDIDLVKPDPAHPKTVLRILDTPAHEAFVVGDHPTDIAAGLASGAYAVGVLSGKIGRNELEQAGAHFIIGDIRGIMDILNSMTLTHKQIVRAYPEVAL